MSDDCSNTKHPLFRDGTSQQQRLLKALLPSFVSVDERSMDDLISFAKKYAEEINFFDSNNITNGNWVDFFTQVIDEKNQQTEPHYALFIAFLDLFRVAQDDLNTITQRHLDFYYRDVLQLQEKAAIPDQVFMVFELAKQVAAAVVSKNTILNAGKDGIGKALNYVIDKDLVVNKAAVKDLKAVFADKTSDYRIYGSPIANSSDGLGGKLNKDEPKWRTFGRNGFSVIDRKQGDVGFAISSPVLFMAEGKRTVTITLTFSQTLTDVDQALLANAFKIEFSGAKNWIEPDRTFNSGPNDASTHFITVNANQIKIARTILESQPAIVAYDQTKLGLPFRTTWPVMRIRLNTDTNFRFMYDKLKNLVLKKADVNVKVSNVRNLSLFSDSAKLQSDKPFDPFTNRPLVGSSFYIGSTEAFSKNLDALDINLIWHGLPTNLGGFQAYYHDYFPNNPKRSNSGFMAEARILDGRTWQDLGSYTLFDDKSITDNISGNIVEVAPTQVEFIEGTKIGVIGMFAFITASYPGHQITPAPAEAKVITINPSLLQTIRRDPNMAPATAVDANTFKGFLRLELTTADFGHKDYPISLTHQITNVAKPVNLVNPPYTPSVKDIWLNYSSTVTLDFTQGINDERIDKYYHVQPFGVMEIHPVLFNSSTPSASFLPQFVEEGSLYVGIDALKPSQILSILFKVSDGSANPDLEKQPVVWSYMVNNRWFDFPKLKILADGTSGLLASGIISFDVPSEATNDNTILPAGLHWLRATVTDSSGAVCDLVDVIAQAVTATFTDNGNDPEHLRLPLPAGTIAKLRESNSKLHKVSQPFESFGGKTKEASNDFYVRVSERLRHKHRAITIWDYERLVLEKFPSIYKVKCISHTEDKPLNYSEIAPGHVTLITVSNLTNKNVINPLQPKTSLTTLEDVKAYITSLTSWWVDLDVRNPDFEEIRTTFNVRFMPGFDNGFYGQKLNEDIKKFLSPWAYEGAAEISFGGHVHRSTILDFVEEQEYVDFVTCFRMDQIIGTTVLADIEEAMTTTAASVLVSAIQHQVTVLETEDCECNDNIQTAQIMPADDVSCDVKTPEPPQKGIGSDSLNGNFIVGYNPNPTGIDFFEIENDFNIS